MTTPPDVITIGRLRLVSLYEVSREFGACPLRTREALILLGVPLYTSPADVEYVELLSLEEKLAEALSLPLSHLDRAGKIYSSMTREAIRARLSIPPKRGRRKPPTTLKRRLPRPIIK